MSSPIILRLRRTDKAGEHLLVHVSRPGRKDSLDLQLIGTDHAHLYHGAIRQSSIKTLQSKPYPSGEGPESWKRTLRYLFLNQRQHSSDVDDDRSDDAIDFPTSDEIAGLELVAAIKDAIFTITVRRNISGITQRLGSVELQMDDEREEVSPFDWVDVAVERSDWLRDRARELEDRLAVQMAEVTKLNARLDEFVALKREDEEEMLGKFARLLNAKKSRIRDLERVVRRKAGGAGADVGVKVEDEGKTRGSAERRVAKVDEPRKGKRKAEEEEDGVEGGEDSDDAERREQDSPERSEGEESEDEGGFEKLSAPVGGKNVGGGKADDPPEGQKDDAMEVDDTALPPRRDLPFAQRKKAGEQRRSEAEVEDEDETDDEL